MKEIEHKYIVTGSRYKEMADNVLRIKQGYLNRDPHRTVRIRTIEYWVESNLISKGYITIKGITVGDSRLEYEYEVPYSDCMELLKLCDGTIIDKSRYIVYYNGYKWEIDEFHSPVSDLVIAEIELTDSNHDYPLPPFVGKEVTGDPRYYNSNI